MKEQPMLERMQPGEDFIDITTSFFSIDENGYLAMYCRTEACRDERNRWDTGSGKLEFGLSPEANVLRESEEELGCNGEITGVLPQHSIIREQEGTVTHWLAVPYFIRVKRNDVVLRETNKHTDLMWERLSTLPTPLHSGFAYTLNRYPERFEDIVHA
jgi:8-oxo-dGTP pyrophosphatase MutT (NUDIX family)